MSMIIETTNYYVESQSHRKYPENWNGDGWLPVPPDFEAVVAENAPYLELEITDGEITGVTPTERPEPETETEPESEYVTWDDLATAIVEGVNEV